MNTKQPRILIPNATSPKNVGDAAMLQVLLSLLKESYPQAEVRIHSSEPQLHDQSLGTLRHTVYSWAAFEKTDVLTRLWRVSQLLSIGTLWLVGIRSVPFGDVTLRELLNDYQQADLIVYVGGGYLRSKSGVTQAINLLMLLGLMVFGQRAPAKTLVAPMSFGPFSTQWQERFAARMLREIDLLSVREPISHQALQRFYPDVLLSHDHALLLPRQARSVRARKQRVVGYTLRTWLPRGLQRRFEASVVRAFFALAQQHDVIFQPIVQVDARKYGDDDELVAQRVADELRSLGSAVKLPIVVADVKHATEVYGTLDLLVGMRMHSNILAATQHVPFVALSYEHKTEGIARSLGVESFCLRVEEVTTSKLLALLLQAFEQLPELTSTLQASLLQVQELERQRWQTLFTKHLTQESLS